MDKFSDDITRYHEGKLTPAERHALEKKSLSDPFLADALAGAEQILPGDFAKDVASLQRKIRGEARPLFTPLRIAAGVALLVATGWLGLQVLDNDKPAMLTLNNQKPASPSPMGAKDSAAANSAEAAEEKKAEQAKVKRDEEPKEEQKKKNQLLALERPRNKKEGPPTQSLDAKEPEEQPAEIQSDLTDFILSSEEAQASRRDVQEDSVLVPLTAQPPQQLAAGATSTATAGEDAKLERRQRQSRASGVAKMAAADDVSRTKITGNVTLADDGLSLPGVNVSVKGSSKGTVTDFNGNYEIEVTEGKPTLVFSFVGLQTKEVSPDSGQTLNVALADDVAQLSEVVVTGKKIPSDPNIEPVINLAEPVGGLKAYDNYLHGNLRYPQTALESNVKGRVTIQFTVGIDGNLNEFTVMKSLGFGCDEEVIRLVKEGPAWNPTTENSVPIESLVRVRMKFDPSKTRK